MLEVPDVELPDATVCSHRCKNVPFLRKMDVVDLLIMSDELCEDGFLFDVPDGAGGVDGAGADEVVELGVPVEGSEGSREVVIVLEVEFKTDLLVVFDLPYLEALAGSCEEVGLLAVLGRVWLTSSGMNIIFVGGYSWGKLHFFSRYLESLSWMI